MTNKIGDLCKFKIIQGIREDLRDQRIKSFFSLSKSFIFTHYPLLFCILSVILLGVLIEHKKLPVFTAPPKNKDITTFHLNDGAEDFRKNLTECSGDWTLTKYGFGLKTGGTGKLRYRVNKDPQDAIFVTIWAYCPPPVENKIILETPSGSVRVENFASEGRDSIPLGKFGEGQKWFDLLIEYKDHTGSISPYMTLVDQISITKINYPYTQLPGFHVILSSVVLTYFIYAFCLFYGLKPFLSGIASLFSIMVLILHLYLFENTWLPIIYLGVMLVLYIIILKRKCDSFEKIWNNPWLICGIVLYITSMSFIWRWNALEKVLFKDMAPDVRGFQGIAQNLKSLYDTGMREPLYVWFLRIVYCFLPLLDINIRMVSFTGSVLMIPLTFHIGRKMGGLLTGTAAAVFLGTSGTLDRLHNKA